VRESARGDWKAQDIVTANLVYKDGEEVYSDIRVGRDRVKGRLEDIQGLRSTGEFGSLLEEIFDPETGRVSCAGVRCNRWPPRREIQLHRAEGPFEVSHSSSRRVVFAAYRGTVWIDVETDRVLRLEQQATGLPDAFPFDKVEMAVDYEFIPAGDQNVPAAGRGTGARLHSRNQRVHAQPDVLP